MIDICFKSHLHMEGFDLFCIIDAEHQPFFIELLEQKRHNFQEVAKAIESHPILRGYQWDHLLFTAVELNKVDFIKNYLSQMKFSLYLKELFAVAAFYGRKELLEHMINDYQYDVFSTCTVVEHFGHSTAIMTPFMAHLQWSILSRHQECTDYILRMMKESGKMWSYKGALQSLCASFRKFNSDYVFQYGQIIFDMLFDEAKGDIQKMSSLASFLDLCEGQAGKELFEHILGVFEANQLQVEPFVETSLAFHPEYFQRIQDNPNFNQDRANQVFLKAIETYNNINYRNLALFMNLNSPLNNAVCSVEGELELKIKWFDLLSISMVDGLLSVYRNVYEKLIHIHGHEKVINYLTKKLTFFDYMDSGVLRVILKESNVVPSLNQWNDLMKTAIIRHDGELFKILLEQKKELGYVLDSNFILEQMIVFDSLDCLILYRQFIGEPSFNEAIKEFESDHRKGALSMLKLALANVASRVFQHLYNDDFVLKSLDSLAHNELLIDTFAQIIDPMDNSVEHGLEDDNDFQAFYKMLCSQLKQKGSGALLNSLIEQEKSYPERALIVQTLLGQDRFVAYYATYGLRDLQDENHEQKLPDEVIDEIIQYVNPLTKAYFINRNSQSLATKNRTLHQAFLDTCMDPIDQPRMPSDDSSEDINPRPTKRQKL